MLESALGLKVVASGVESDSLRNCLKHQQCDAIQGFIFSRPMPAAFLEEWMQGKHATPLGKSNRGQELNLR